MQFNDDYNVTRNGTINFSSKTIDYVSSASFHGVDPATVIYVDLSNNKIPNVPAGMFEGLKEMRQLWLQNNLIELDGHDAFTDLVKLQSINLEKNQIQSIPDDTFVATIKLQTIRTAFE